MVDNLLKILRFLLSPIKRRDTANVATDQCQNNSCPSPCLAVGTHSCPAGSLCTSPSAVPSAGGPGRWPQAGQTCVFLGSSPRLVEWQRLQQSLNERMKTTRKAIISTRVFSSGDAQTKTKKSNLTLTHGGRDGASSLWGVQTCSCDLLVWGPGLDVPGGAVLSVQGLLFTVVIFHVVMQQFGLPEGLGASRSVALERVVVEIDGQDRWRLVFDHSVHCKQKSLRGERVTNKADSSRLDKWGRFSYVVLCWTCWGCGSPAFSPLKRIRRGFFFISVHTRDANYRSIL